jgi:hypothetical protein
MSTIWRSGDSLLPPPGDLDRYVQHLPDAAERLLAAAEREQAHRHQLENGLLAIDRDAVPRSFESHRRACWIALVVGLAYLAVMVGAIFEGSRPRGRVVPRSAWPRWPGRAPPSASARPPTSWVLTVEVAVCAPGGGGVCPCGPKSTFLWETPHLDEAVALVGEMRTNPAPAVNPRRCSPTNLDVVPNVGLTPRRPRSFHTPFPAGFRGGCWKKSANASCGWTATTLRCRAR